MSDGFGGVTEVTTESYCEKMQNAIAGVCIGALLFFGSWGVLFWNEGRAVRRQEDLDEGRGIVQQIGLTAINATIDKSLDTKLVYVTGLVDGGNDVLYDEYFDINVTNATGGAIKYERSVEMYQWEERSKTKTEKMPNGATRRVTTYLYHKKWSSSLISSSSFKEAVTPSNPTSFLVNYEKLASNDIGLGPFRLSSDITSQIDWDTRWYDVPLNASNIVFDGYMTTFSGGELRIRKSSGLDSIGDHKVDFYTVMPDDISVVAMQDATGQLGPYITSGDRELLLFSRGTITSDGLFNQAEEDNNQLTWILRFAGFLCIVIGICLILNPIATAFDVLPFVGDCIGDMVGCMVLCIALVISIPLSLLIISIAWIFYRPYFAVGSLVMLGILAFVFFKYLKPQLSKPQGQQQANNPAGKPPNQGFNENYGGQPPQAEATAVPVGGYNEQPYKEVPAPSYGQSTNYPPQADKPDFANALDNPPPATNPGFSPPPSYPPAENSGFSPPPSYPPPASNTGGGYVPP